MTQHNMKAIVATGYGAPSVLQFQTVAKPVPSENEVLVKVHATSATRADSMVRTGKPYFGRLIIGLKRPKHPIPGTGFAGVVEAVGSEVGLFKPGDRVFGETTTKFSTNAEYVTVPELGVVLPMPENMPYTEAATYGDGHLTSLNFLKEIAKVSPGQRVLINGASGSLGTAAVQLAKYYGAHVTGVCSSRNVGLVKALGADVVIDYTQDDFTQGDARYDVIYDTVGKSSFGKSKRVLNPRGQFISPVISLGLLWRSITSSIFGSKRAKFAATGMKAEGDLRKMMHDLVAIYKEGRLRTIIDRQYPLEKVAEAHAYIASGRKKGNVVIMVQP